MPARQAPPQVDLEKILQILVTSPKALSSKAIAEPLGLKSTQLKAALAELLQSERIFAHSKSTYWHKPKPVVLSPAQLIALGREKLLEFSARELLNAAALKSLVAQALPTIKATAIEAVRKQLLKEALLREVSPPGEVKSKEKLCVNVQHPQAYLTQAIGALLAGFGIERSAAQIERLLGSSDQAPSLSPVADLLFAAVQRIAFSPGTTVTFHRLRQQPELAKVPKADFDQAALQLQRERRALLSEHGHAARLPQDEQDSLVSDGLGNFYVSIYSL